MIEFKGQTSIAIQAPVEKVYDYLIDFPRHPEWAKNLTKVTQTSPGPITVGTTFKTEEGPPPAPVAVQLVMMAHFFSGVLSGAKTFSDTEITALEANHRIAWQAGIRKGESYLSFAEWEFLFEPQDGGTLLTQRFRYAPPDPKGQRMIAAAGADGIAQACAVSLAQLKQKLEQTPNGKH